MIHTERKEIYLRYFRRISLLLLLGMSVLSTGCMSVKMYVDPTLPKVAITDLKPVENKQAVQVLFEFQTNGALNSKATEHVRPMILESLKNSNLFGELITTGTADRKLFITINNGALTKDAASKGFVTGLTLGLAGSMVTDNYFMNAIYSAPGQSDVKHSYQHAIHTTVGNANGPANLTAVKPAEAISGVMNDLILNLLKEMSLKGELK